MDEPTNHLDLEAIAWLEEFLIDLDSTVIVVSHDRHFLNKVCTHTVDIDYKKVTMYVGNYDFWYEYTQMAQRQMREQNKRPRQKSRSFRTSYPVSAQMRQNQNRPQAAKNFLTA